MILQEVIQKISINADWYNNAKKWLPLIRQEAITGKNCDEWDKDVFSEFFLNRREHCISSLQQGYFTNNEINSIKRIWPDLAPMFKQLAEHPLEYKLDLYHKINRLIHGCIKGQRNASVRRLIASLQPELFCSLVTDRHFKNLYKYLENYTDVKCPAKTNDWFIYSHEMKNIINECLPPNTDRFAALQYPWLIHDYFDNVMTIQFKNNLKNKLADTEFKVVKANNKDTFIWIGTKDGTIGNSQCHYEICFDSTGIHQKDKAYVEIHFEDSNRAFFNENVVIPLSENPNIRRFKWGKGCDGLRINDNGYDFKTTDCTDAIVAELMELDRQAGNTII